MPASSIGVGLQSLQTHPLRTLLSTLGVIIGSASLSAVLSLGDGAEAFARQRLEREGLARVSLLAVTSDLVDGHRVPRGSYPMFEHADAVDVAAAVPDATVTLDVSGTALTHIGGTRRAVTLRGVWLTGTNRPPAPLHAGRWMRGEELDEGAAVAVVTPDTAATLTGGAAASAIGRSLVMGNRPFTIVGVLSRSPGDRGLAAVVPLAAADHALVDVMPPRARSLHVDVGRAEDTAGARLRLERLMQQRTDWRDRTRLAAHGTERLREVAQGMLIMKLLLGAFASISLVVGGIGIMNVLLASVVERTREIGIRKAVGARRRDIVMQFMAESIAIAATGSMLGVAAGLLTAFAVTALIRARTDALLYASIAPGSVLASAGAALVVGVVFGIYPALRAARLSPIDAIVRE